MAALFSGPGERRFAKDLHVVDLECHCRSYYLDFFLVILKLQGGPKSDEISHIFRPRPQTFCSHARTRQNIVILKKNSLSTDGFSTTYATFGELWPTNPWDPRAPKFLKNDTPPTGQKVGGGQKNFFLLAKLPPPHFQNRGATPA